ncbi:MAG: hypothetical protein ACYS30_26340 [Planctomycetota bacterium]
MNKCRDKPYRKACTKHKPEGQLLAKTYKGQKLPGLSRANQISTISPVNGITAIRPASVGSLRPI